MERSSSRSSSVDSRMQPNPRVGGSPGSLQGRASWGVTLFTRRGMYSMMTPSSSSSEALSRPELRRYLEAYVRRRVTTSDADDLVQAVLCAALEAPRVPEDREEVRKWITGIARRKLAAHYEKRAHEQLGEPPDLEATPAPLEASSLMRWVERQAALSEAERVDETLDWMARESDGEKLETIAIEARVPATSVR